MKCCSPCCCFPLRIGTIIIATTSIIISILYMGRAFLLFEETRGSVNGTNYNKDDYDDDSTIPSISMRIREDNISIKFLVIGIFGVAFFLVLLVGAIKRKKKVVTIWFYVFASFCGFEFFLHTLLYLGGFLLGSVYKDFGLKEILSMIVHYYIVWLVYAFQKELHTNSENSEEGLNDGAHSPIAITDICQDSQDDKV